MSRCVMRVQLSIYDQTDWIAHGHRMLPSRFSKNDQIFDSPFNGYVLHRTYGKTHSFRHEKLKMADNLCLLLQTAEKYNEISLIRIPFVWKTRYPEISWEHKCPD